MSHSLTGILRLRLAFSVLLAAPAPLQARADSLHGVLRWIDGTPLANHAVLVVEQETRRAALDPGRSLFVRARWELWPDTGFALDEEPGKVALVRTDAEGRFEVRGLLPGHYFLDSDCLAFERWWDEKVPLVETGDAEVDLVSDLVHLTVTSKDGLGRVLPRQTPSFQFDGGFPSVHSTLLLPNGTPVALERIAGDPAEQGPAQCVVDLWVAPGTYLVTACSKRPLPGVPDDPVTSPSVETVDRWITVPAGAKECDAELRFSGPESPRGTLLVTLDSQDEWTKRGSFELRTARSNQSTSPGSRAAIPTFSFGEALEVPEGPWLVQFHPWGPPTEPLGPWKVVDVKKGETTEVVFTDRELRHGRLRVSIDPRHSTESKLPLPPFDLFLTLPDSGPSQYLRWEGDQEAPVPGGEPRLSAPTPVGDYLLWAVRPGSAPICSPVTVRADGIEEVVLR